MQSTTTRREQVARALHVPAGHDAWAHYQPRYEALLGANLSAEDVPTWLQRWSDVAAELQGAEHRLHIQADLNTADENVQSRLQQFTAEVLPVAQRTEQQLKEKWLSVDGYTPAPDVALLYRRTKDTAALFCEANVQLGAVQAEQTQRHSQLTAGQTVTFDGEELSLFEVDAAMDNPDRATRERAWRALIAGEQRQAEPLGALMLELLQTRRQLADNAGLPDYRAFRWRELGRSDYTPEQCRSFHQALAQQVVPLAAQNMERIAEALGLDTIRPWDYTRYNLPDPKARPPLKLFEGVNELEELAAQVFQRMDAGFAACFENMRAEGLLDLEHREGRAPVGYCSYFPATNQPFLALDALGTAENVQFLFHEMGHAFHGFYSGEAQPLLWNRWSPMEFAELPSSAMELLALEHLEGLVDAEALQRYRRQVLLGIVAFLPWAAQVDAFQHWLYAEAPASVTVDDLNAKWLELDKTFHPFVNWDGLDEAARAGGWCFYHIFQRPFYYIEYAFCYLAALAIWQRSLQHPQQALADYKAALRLGNTRPVPELYATAGAEFRFDREYIGELMTFVEQELTKLED